MPDELNLCIGALRKRKIGFPDTLLTSDSQIALFYTTFGLLTEVFNHSTIVLC